MFFTEIAIVLSFGAGMVVMTIAYEVYRCCHNKSKVQQGLGEIPI